MKKIYAQYKDIVIEAEQGDQGLSSIRILPKKNKKLTSNTRSLAQKIDAAIKGPITANDLDLSWATPFQKKVYREMMKIKPGKVLTYKQLAEKIGQPNAFRAVARACATNKLPLLIPCHRVVRTDGGLGGYSAGDGVRVKQYLLDLEGYQAA